MKINKPKLANLASFFLFFGTGWTLTAILRAKTGIEIGLVSILLGVIAASIRLVLDDE